MMEEGKKKVAAPYFSKQRHVTAAEEGETKSTEKR